MSVYVIQCTVTKAIKVGWSTNVERRFCTIQGGCPTKLRIVRLVEMAPRNLEAEAHRALAGGHIRGEWFSGDFLPIFDALITSVDMERLRIEVEAHDESLRAFRDWYVSKIGERPRFRVMKRGIKRGAGHGGLAVAMRAEVAALRATTKNTTHGDAHAAHQARS